MVAQMLQNSTYNKYIYIQAFIFNFNEIDSNLRQKSYKIQHNLFKFNKLSVFIILNNNFTYK